MLAKDDQRVPVSDWPDGHACYRYGDKLYIRASSVGRCMIEAVGSLLEYEPMPHNQHAERWFHEGRLHEADILGQLKEKTGWQIEVPEDGQWQVLENVALPKPMLGVEWVTIVGHVDALASGSEEHATSSGVPGKPVSYSSPFDRMPVEAKTVGQWTWDNEVHKKGLERWVKQKMPYAYQFQVYLNGTAKRRGLYAVKNRNSGELIWEVIGSPLVPDAPATRVVTIMEWAEKGVLPPCDGKCSSFMSAWWHIHEQKKQPPTREVRDARAGRLVKGYREALKIEKDLKRQKEAIKDELRPMLGEGTWRISVEDDIPATVTVGDKEVKRLSREKLEEKFGEEGLSQFYESMTYPNSVTIR